MQKFNHLIKHKSNSSPYWLPLKEAAKVLNKPERTLRLYAAQGKIKVKRQGKYWFCEISAPLGTSKLSCNAQSNLVSQQQLSDDDVTSDFSVLFDSKNDLNAPFSARKNKFKQILDLGVYRDLLQIFLQLDKSETSPNIQILHKNSLVLLAQGFYEFEQKSKIEFFKNARQTLAALVVEAQIESSAQMNELTHKIENLILPGVSGLIRKIEKKKDSL